MFRITPVLLGWDYCAVDRCLPQPHSRITVDVLFPLVPPRRLEIFTAVQRPLTLELEAPLLPPPGRPGRSRVVHRP